MRIQYDIAYGSFFLVGVGVLGITLGSLLRIRLSEGALAFLGIGFAVLGVVALLVGVGYSLVLWRHFPLRLLLLCSLLFVGTLLFEDAASSTFVDTVSLLYGLACSMLSVRWFFIIRRRFE